MAAPGLNDLDFGFLRVGEGRETGQLDKPRDDQICGLFRYLQSSNRPK